MPRRGLQAAYPKLCACDSYLGLCCHTLVNLIPSGYPAHHRVQHKAADCSALTLGSFTNLLSLLSGASNEQCRSFFRVGWCLRTTILQQRIVTRHTVHWVRVLHISVTETRHELREAENKVGRLTARPAE